VSEDRMPFLFDPHALAFLEDPHHYLCHLANTFCTALGRCSQIEETRWMAKFHRRIADLGICDVECIGLSAEDEVRVALHIHSAKGLNWARTCIALGVASEADPYDPQSVLSKLFWPVGTWCQARDA
jgi:hypothetical protein